jgi:hypothetical protein
MNERIRELAEQANIRFGRMAILDGDPRGMARYVTYSEFEKFAELIVQRTLAIVEAHTEIFQSDQARAMVEHIKHSVKTDFGVES